jgi:ADP-ribosylglycohydrolase
MSESSVRMARARRSLDGLSVGDALGALAVVQGRQLPAGRWPYTDDTAMACSVVEALQELGAIDSEDLFQRFVHSHKAQPNRGYGIGMILIFQQIEAGMGWQDAVSNVFESGSFGNGAAMRVAPLGAYFAEDYHQVATQAKASAMSTHVHPEGIAGAIAVAVAAAANVRGEPDLFVPVLEQTPLGLTRDGLLRAHRLHVTPEEAAELLGSGQQVTAQDTVPFCIWCASRYRDSFVECFWSTLAGQGDRDTTCAITGGIVALGANDIPDEWLARRESLPLQH